MPSVNISFDDNRAAINVRVSRRFLVCKQTASVTCSKDLRRLSLSVDMSHDNNKKAMNVKVSEHGQAAKATWSVTHTKGIEQGLLYAESALTTPDQLSIQGGWTISCEQNISDAEHSTKEVLSGA